MRFWYSRNGAALTGFLAVASYFLWTEHSAHVVAYLPWILVAGFMLIMFSILLVMYLCLSLTEERETEALFGERYKRYAGTTPRFIPAFRPGSRCSKHGSELG